jgi:arylformamidase
MAGTRSDPVASSSGRRVIELSHVLLPGREYYGLEVTTRYVDEAFPEYSRPADAHYVISEIRLGSHVGTHIESPFHYLADGADLAAIPLERLVGDASLIDLAGVRGTDEPIGLGDLVGRAQHVQQGDIVLVRTGLSVHYRTPAHRDRPFFSQEAIEFLVDQKIACLGVDCSGVENRGDPDQPLHRLLFSHGVPLIEHLTNLEYLRRRRFFCACVPIRVCRLEACPVAVIAVED